MLISVQATQTKVDFFCQVVFFVHFTGKYAHAHAQKSEKNDIRFNSIADISKNVNFVHTIRD